MKIIWLVNYYAMPPEHESRLRTIKFAHFLQNYGYKVIIISSSFLHNKNVNLINNRKFVKECSYEKLKFYHIKTISYSKTGIKRYLSLFLFHFCLHLLKNKLPKPNYIIHSCMPPFGNVTAYTAKKLKSKYIAEVQDLWPESFLTFGLIKKNNIFFKILYSFEKALYSKADAIVFSMEGGINYLKEKRWLLSDGGKIDPKKVFYINNGVDISEFDNNRNKYVFDDEILKNKRLFKVIYMGSIRHANNLIRLIDAASILNSYDDILFMLYGDGEERTVLESYCKENKIENVHFKQKWIDPKYVPFVLSQASLLILNYFPNSIFKYGGSQSKLYQYFASGKPICSNIEMGYCPIKKYNIGIAREFKSAEEYADAILRFYKMDSDSYQKMCEKAREASYDYDYKLLTERMHSILCSLN